MSFDPLIYNKHFITKVKKRGRIRKFFNWIVFGALAVQYFQVWTWDGYVLKKESGFIEKSLIEKKSIKPAGMILATVVYFQTAGTQTWDVPIDWNNGNNSIECIGAGGGAGPAINYYPGGGGGGGAYAKSVNVSISGTIYLHVADITPGDGYHNGDYTWVNFLTNGYPGDSSQGVQAQGGYTGQGWSGGQALGGGGGSIVACIYNSVAYSGGDGGTTTDSNYSAAPGGGGAAGPHGGGGGGGTTSSIDQWSAPGGAGDAGYGGAGGPGQSSDNWGNPGSGGAVSPFSGGGGGGARSVDTGTARQGGSGGAYGGGGGGGSGSAGGGGYGVTGIIVITYVPLPPGGMLTLFMGI